MARTSNRRRRDDSPDVTPTAAGGAASDTVPSGLQMARASTALEPVRGHSMAPRAWPKSIIKIRQSVEMGYCRGILAPPQIHDFPSRLPISPDFRISRAWANRPKPLACSSRCALYGKRVGLLGPESDITFVGFKEAAFSVYFEDAPIFHFDLEGRWQRAYHQGLHYLKALDTTTQVIERVREGPNLVLRRRTLSSDATAEFDDLVRGSVVDLLERLDLGGLQPIEPPPQAQTLGRDELREFLDRIAAWDASAWSAYRDDYSRTYGPWPVLPPDCLNAVVLQASLGHADGVTFGLSAAAPHRVRTTDEFARHARAVAELLGRRVTQSRGVFLAGSDVLRRPVDDVAAYLETSARIFPLKGGIHTVLDRFEAPRPRADDWRRFASLGLRRVGLAVESGAPGVRALYGKTWADDDLRAVVADLKGAGLGVGVLTLVDAGGAEHATAHVEATAALTQQPGTRTRRSDLAARCRGGTPPRYRRTAPRAGIHAPGSGRSGRAAGRPTPGVNPVALRAGGEGGALPPRQAGNGLSDPVSPRVQPGLRGTWRKRRAPPAGRHFGPWSARMRRLSGSSPWPRAGSPRGCTPRVGRGG